MKITFGGGGERLLPMFLRMKDEKRGMGCFKAVILGNTHRYT